MFTTIVVILLASYLPLQLLYYLYKAYRERRRLKVTRCPSCGHDLTSDPSTVCPKCGQTHGPSPQGPRS